MAIFSTDWRTYSESWWVNDIPDAALAGMLGIPGDQILARRAQLAEQQREPAWVESVLDSLPAATLSILQLLAEGGGIASDRRLARAAQERYGLRPDLYRHAVLPAIRAVLVVPLSAPDAESGVALVHPAARLVSPRVIDLDVTPLSTAAFVPGAPAGVDPRAFLALCSATRHVDVKLNKDGSLHLGTIKRLAKQVGIDERSAHHALCVALDARLMTTDGDLVRPDVSAMVAAAAGRYPEGTALAALQALLTGGPIGREAILRWCERRDLLHIVGIMFEGQSSLPGFISGTIDGKPALAYAAPGGSTSGHITPSFEVILPPESRLLDVVHVGACCDWVRLDRALVARITRPAVARTLAAGATGDEILGWLASVSQHPIPQNVEVAIRDWAGAVIPATLATGHVVVVDAAAEGHALAALGKLAPRRVAPGVLVVASAVTARDVSRALVAAGIQLGTGGRPPPRPAATNEPSAPSLGAGRLRGKLAAWMRGEPFEGVRDSYLDHVVESPAAKSAAAAARAPAISPAPQPPAQRAPLPRPVLLWQQEQLLTRLEAAAERCEWLALDLGGARRCVEIERVARRGSMWFVLGEDLDDGTAVALPLDKITAIAALPDDVDLDGLLDGDHVAPDAQLGGPRPWSPPPGKPVPPGHVACPCGSGERYRNCCRGVAQA